MSSRYYEPAESKDILKKTFINQNDFYILLGRKCEQNRLLFLEIKAKIKEDLAKNGKRLLDSRHIPLNRALEYLKDYGISRKGILSNAEAFKN